MPKRLGGLFDEVCAPENLWRAWLEFRRGKRSRPTVRAFELDAVERLPALRRALLGGAYRPRAHRLSFIHEPKQRLIAAAPVVDRIVHHAVHRVLAPRLDPGLVDTTYACLPGRGSHRAVLAFRGALLRHRHALLLDVRHYFPAIDREVLAAVMERRIKDRALLDLLRLIADAGAGLYRAPAVRDFIGLAADYPAPGRGLAIGNLTSQWWGNHYLSGFDHLVKRALRIPHYQRYMDDMTLFADSAAALEDARDEAAEWLWRERGLRLKHPGARPRDARRAFRYLGHRVSRAGIEPLAAVLGRAGRRLQERVLRGDAEQVRRSVAAYRGLLAWPGG